MKFSDQLYQKIIQSQNIFVTFGIYDFNGFSAMINKKTEKTVPAEANNNDNIKEC